MEKYQQNIVLNEYQQEKQSKDPIYIEFKSLLKEVNYFIQDHNLDLNDFQSVFQLCLEYISYLSFNNAKIVCKKNEKTNRWQTTIVETKENEIKETPPIESSDKTLSIISATVYYKIIKSDKIIFYPKADDYSI